MKFITPVLLCTLLMGCAQKESSVQADAPKLINSKIISERPQNLENVVALIRLQSPSLFASAKRENGQLIINENLKQQVLKEQKEALEKLQKISSEIKLLFSYKFTLNALAVVTPIEHYSEVSGLESATAVHKEVIFQRLATSQAQSKAKNFDITSVSHIGALKANSELGLKGKNISVGIIDTGIDYTHAMFLGPGTKESYEAQNPDTSSDLYPNKKIIGGYDFVGTNYSPGAAFPDHRIPRPDSNPLDEGGHGTHVAGSVAGLGDGINTYDGVAPEADLYALKVFGANGGTSDSVVIAAMEFAADPNQDLDPSDHLDVVNLSLGGDFGKPYIMYSLAVKNLSKGGTVVVAAAGNSGHNSYIVGAPSTANEAISVAASVDGMFQNWKFDTVEFKTKDGPLLAKAIEGKISRPISDSKEVQGELVYAGVAASDFDEEMKAKLKGKVALIDRGEVSFIDKLKRAHEAQAIGVIMANNKPGDAFEMGGGEKVDLPAIMITKSFGDILKEKMSKNNVQVDFGTEAQIEKPEIIDTLTGFSSRGPRSEDSLIKPEIAAPGFKIISAAMASGNQGAALNGTSMATPHVAGVMALMKEKYPKLMVSELKDLLLNSAKLMDDESGSTYPVSMQGAGLVQTFKALTTNTILSPSTISLGETSLVSSKVMKRKLTLKNLGSDKATFSFSAIEGKNFQIFLPKSLELDAGETQEIKVSFVLKKNNLKAEAIQEFEGQILVKRNENHEAIVPVLSIARVLSKIKAETFNILAEDEDEYAGASVELKLENLGKNPGLVIPFNLLGKDKRKPSLPGQNLVKSRSCDLAALGSKVISKGNQKILQLGIKLHNPVSRWQGCEISFQIDTDGDKVAEQELVGLSSSNLRGLRDLVKSGYYSVLLDAKKVRDLRKAYELDAANNQGKPSIRLNYSSAVEDILEYETFNHSTISIVQVDISKLKLREDGQFLMRAAVLGEGGIESDDYLGDNWLLVNSYEDDQSYLNLPEKIKLNAGESLELDFTKGEGKENLMLLYPYNKPVSLNSRVKDQQIEIL